MIRAPGLHDIVRTVHRHRSGAFPSYPPLESILSKIEERPLSGYDDLDIHEIESVMAPLEAEHGIEQLKARSRWTRNISR